MFSPFDWVERQAWISVQPWFPALRAAADLGSVMTDYGPNKQRLCGTSNRRALRRLGIPISFPETSLSQPLVHLWLRGYNCTLPVATVLETLCRSAIHCRNLASSPSAMSFLGGAECSTGANPLAQFLQNIRKMTRALQRDRLAIGPGRCHAREHAIAGACTPGRIMYRGEACSLGALGKAVADTLVVDDGRVSCSSLLELQLWSGAIALANGEYATGAPADVSTVQRLQQRGPAEFEPGLAGGTGASRRRWLAGTQSRGVCSRYPASVNPAARVTKLRSQVQPVPDGRVS